MSDAAKSAKKNTPESNTQCGRHVDMPESTSGQKTPKIVKPDREMDKPEDPSRRKAVMQFLSGIFVGVVSNKVTPYVPPFSPGDGRPPQLSGLNSVAPTVKERRVGIDAKSSLAYQLFLASSSPIIDFTAPQDWKSSDGNIKLPDTALPNGLVTYGHEAEVFKTMSNFLTREFGSDWHELETAPFAGPANSELLIASGASNKRVAQIMGIPETPQFGLSSCRLHYSIGEKKQILTRWQYGGWRTPFMHTVCCRDDRDILCPESIGGEQSTDYLLVTRMPGETPGTTLTILAGLHGPGTRSAEKLFTSLRYQDLLRLGEILGLKPGEVPHFQAVFKASAFKRNADNDPTNSDVAAELELVTSKDFSPRRLDI